MAYKSKSKKNKRCSKRKNRMTRRKKGGSCGCGKPFLGGSAYLSAVPTHAYYPYNNNIMVDPQNPANVGDARFMGDYSRMAGGRRRRRGRKTKGGSNFFSNLYTHLANSGAGMNYINSFGAVNGSINQSGLVTGANSNIANSTVTNPPVLSQPYGFQNPPLA